MKKSQSTKTRSTKAVKAVKKKPAKKTYSYIPWQEVTALILVGAVALFFVFGTRKSVTNTTGGCPPQDGPINTDLCFEINTNDAKIGWPLDYHYTSSATDPDLNEIEGLGTSTWNKYRLASDLLFFAIISGTLMWLGLATMHPKKR